MDGGGEWRVKRVMEESHPDPLMSLMLRRGTRGRAVEMVGSKRRGWDAGARPVMVLQPT